MKESRMLNEEEKLELKLWLKWLKEMNNKKVA